MREAVPSYLSDVKALKEYYKIIENTRSVVETHTCSQKPMEIMMAKDILCTLASSSSSSSCRGMAGVLGINKWNIRRGIKRGIQLDGLNQPFWINYRRSTRTDSILVTTKNLVQEWHWNQGRVRGTSYPLLCKHPKCTLNSLSYIPCCFCSLPRILSLLLRYHCNASFRQRGTC